MLSSRLGPLPPRLLCAAVCASSEEGPACYELGKSKVFFRSNVAMPLILLLRAASIDVCASVLLVWKLRMWRREHDVVQRVKRWAQRCRTGGLRVAPASSSPRRRTSLGSKILSITLRLSTFATEHPGDSLLIAACYSCYLPLATCRLTTCYLLRAALLPATCGLLPFWPLPAMCYLTCYLLPYLLLAACCLTAC